MKVVLSSIKTTRRQRSMNAGEDNSNEVHTPKCNLTPNDEANVNAVFRCVC